MAIPWKPEYDQELMVKYQSGEPVDIMEMANRIECSPKTVRMHIRRFCTKNKLRAKGISGFRCTIVDEAGMPPSRSEYQMIKDKPKPPEGSQKYMCKCESPVGIVWLSILALSEAAVKRRIKTDYPGVTKVVKIMKAADYAAMRSQVQIPVSPPLYNPLTFKFSSNRRY